MPTLEQLEKMLASDPRDSFVLYAIAQEHAKAGRHEQAVAFYDRCVGVDPNYSYAYFHKARSLEALGRGEEAIDTLRSGTQAAAASGDAKAAGEIEEYLAMLGGGGA